MLTIEEVWKVFTENEDLFNIHDSGNRIQNYSADMYMVPLTMNTDVAIIIISIATQYPDSR